MAEQPGAAFWTVTFPLDRVLPSQMVQRSPSCVSSHIVWLLVDVTTQLEPDGKLYLMHTLDRQRWTIDGCQNHWCRSCRVQLTPGWQASLEEWPHWTTFTLSQGSTACSWELPPGPSHHVSRTCSSTGHEATTTMQDDRRIGMGLRSDWSRVNWRNKASAFVFLEPGCKSTQRQIFPGKGLSVLANSLVA